VNERRIALVTSSAAEGGAQRVVANLASGLAARAVGVDLVLAEAVGPYLARLHPDVNVVDLGGHRMARAAWPLARYLRKERPALVFTALDYVNVVALAARALAGVRVPLVVSEHNTLSQAVAHSSSRRTRWMPALLRVAYPHADGVVAVSRGVADDLVALCRLPSGSVTVLNNPIVSPELLRMREERAEHPWLDDGNVPVFVAVGRLVPQKDFATLIEAFATARSQRAARLIILGDGPLRGDLEALADGLGVSQDVSLPGFCANPYAVMAGARALVLSSAWEGLPTVLVEALACGTSVIATDCPSGPAEILDGGRLGTLVPVGDVAALAEAMLASMDGPPAPVPADGWRDYTREAVTAAYLRYFSSIWASA
jgi:glycosyltransferase involved in cell wall biosynthesis